MNVSYTCSNSTNRTMSAPMQAMSACAHTARFNSIIAILDAMIMASIIICTIFILRSITMIAIIILGVALIMGQVNKAKMRKPL